MQDNLARLNDSWQRLRKEGKVLKTSLPWLNDIIARHKDKSLTEVIKLVKKKSPAFDMVAFLNSTQLARSNSPFLAIPKIFDEFVSSLSDIQTYLNEIIELSYSYAKRLCVECGQSVDMISKNEIATTLPKRLKTYEKFYRGFFWEFGNFNEYRKNLSEFVCSEVATLCKKKLNAHLKKKIYGINQAIEQQERKLAKAYMQRAKAQALCLIIDNQSPSNTDKSKQKE